MNSSEKEDFFEYNNLNDEEKEKAKQNGFIMVGKTGTRKTTILNAIFNNVVGKVESSSESVTKITSIYYYKLKNGNVITLIDTPGLADSERIEYENIDKMHLDGITKAISDEKICIKGILFLINFQNKRFDADEQEALLNYKTLFPLKNFWKKLIIVYTHFFADPNDDFDEEEMKNERKINNSEIFKELMEKVKAVSDQFLMMI
jgi:GTPase Era involved in 16S rRNA processing